MEAVAHSPKFAKKVGVPQSVGKDFAAADKGKTFKKGGTNMATKSINPRMMAMAARAMRRAPVSAPVNPLAAQAPMPPAMPGMKKGGKVHDDIMEDKKLIKKAFRMHDTQEHKGEHTNLSKLKKGGVMKKAKGGMIEKIGPKSMSKDVEKGSNKLEKFGESAVQKRGHTKGYNLGDAGKTVKPKDIKPMRKGGYAKVADGIAQRGKTKGKFC